MSECSIYNKIQAALNEAADGELGVQCDGCSELDGIRADILVNFGEVENNRFPGLGISFKNEYKMTTRQMVVKLISHLIAMLDPPKSAPLDDTDITT